MSKENKNSPPQAAQPRSKGIPANVDAERFVLGSILLDNSFLNDCTSLSPDVFALESHRRIFRRIMELRSRNEHVDRVTVANELTRYSELDTCGGISYLVTLDDGLPAVPDIRSYIQILQDKHALRRLIFLGQRTVNAAMAATDPPLKIIREVSDEALRLEVSVGEGVSLKSAGQIFEEHEGGMAGFLMNSVKPGIPTGFIQLDEKILGLHRKQQYVIAGSPGSGKSALAGNMAVNLAKRGEGVAIYSLEMSKEQLLARMICSEAKVPIKAYIKGDMMSDQRNAAMRAAAMISELPLYIDDTPGLTITELIRRVTRAKSERGISAYVLDYLQLLDYQSDKEMKFFREYDAITFASHACLTTARRHDLVSVIISQLSRPSNDRKKSGDRPVLSDLKGTGAIEQDAVAVMFVWREEMHKPGDPALRGKAEILIRKSRMGETGTANLEYIGKWTKFIDPGLLEGSSE